MAQYNRQILVPYLRDVCTLEMLCAKLKRDINDAKNLCNALNYRINEKMVEPSLPIKQFYEISEHKRSNIIANFVIFVIPAFAIALAIFHFTKWNGWFFELLFTLWGLFWTVSGISDIRDVLSDRDRRYNADLDKYNKQKQENEYRRKQQPDLVARLAEKKELIEVLTSKLKQATQLKNDLYSINIIPSNYRNIHVSYYLYNYFETSRETDLDKIIQTLLLDEIVQRLDKVIAQNEEIVLNQRMQIALQEHQNKQIAENNRNQMYTLARMEKNQELQNDYQKMIAKNAILTNFLISSEILHRDKHRNNAW